MNVLDALGGRSDVVTTADFETFYSSEYGLKKLTTEAYVRDPRFEVTGVGVQIGRGEPVWLEEWDFKKWAKTVNWARCAVVAHHAQFDAFILSELYGIRPGFLACTMGMGRAMHGTGALAELGPLYGLGEKGDVIEKGSLKGKRRAEITQAQWIELGEYCKQDVRLTAGIFYAMRARFPSAELWLNDTTIRMFTEPVFEADQVVLNAALVEEQTKKKAMLERIAALAGPMAPERSPRSKKPAPTPLEIAKKVLGSNEKFAALLLSLGEEPPTKFNDKSETIYAFAKDDPGMQELLESPREEIRQLAEARLSVKSNIDETRVTRLIGIAMRGLVPFYLKFCGAHTHRWSGGDKMNPQNFRRGGSLRAAILAMLRWVLVVVDSGQIEARVSGWFAGEQGLLESFRRNDAKTLVWQSAFDERVRQLGREPSEDEAKTINRDLAAQGIEEGDFYSDEGSRFFMMKISKAETKTERQLSKNMILGLGFSMGWATFATNLLAGMLGSKPVQFTLKEVQKFRIDVDAFEARKYGWGEGVSCGAHVRTMIDNGARLPYDQLLIHCAVADHFTRRYRETYKRIANCWRSCDQVIELMARDPAPGETPDTVRMQFGCLKVVHRGLVKPSGLALRYPQLRKSSGGYSYLGGDSGRERVSLYGGKLFENIVQSLARDIVAEQMLRIRADGHKIGTCTHDEVVAVVPEGRGQEVLAQALAHFRTPPDWCADLPLNAEGGVGRSYGAC